MREIDKIFDAKVTSVQQVFHTAAGVAGFRIPEYQRQYSWDEENIVCKSESLNSASINFNIRKTY